LPAPHVPREHLVARYRTSCPEASVATGYTGTGIGT
jgi:hypothetical protein